MFNAVVKRYPNVTNHAVTMLTVRSDLGASVFTWGVWLIMVLAALYILMTSGRIFPLNEDWWLVSPMTGNEPSLLKWFWLQNSEHRIPFPRLILLALLKVTHGDFRVGMLFNILILAALAFMMIRVAGKVRGGRTSYADAFFPIALLHLGNAENLFWCWQLTQVVPTVLTCVLLLVIVANQTLTLPKAAVVGGITLMLLPISGSHALLFVPSFALWFGYCGILYWRVVKNKEGQGWTGGFLIGSAVVALGLTALHFLTYEHPSWRPPDPTIVAALKTAVKFLALGFGPAVRSLWRPYLLAIIILLAGSAVVTMLAVLRRRDNERYRAFGVLLFLGNIVVLALATGWGRATAIESVYGQYPLRYVTMAVPTLLTVFFVWVLYGPAWLRTAVQGGLLVVMCLLIPANTLQGLGWHYWFPDRDRSLQQDLQAGMTASVLAERYQGLLLHFREPAEIAHYMRMLRDASIEPFAQMAADSDEPVDSIQAVASTQAQLETQAQSVASDVDTPLVSVKIRYSSAEVSTVYLVWGMDGWQVAPEELRPAGTEVRDNVMHTPMVREGTVFAAKIQVPAGTTIDYGFLITEKRGIFDITEPAWDWGIEGYRTIVLEHGVTEVQASLGLTGYMFSIDFGRYLLAAVGVMFGIALVIMRIQGSTFDYIARNLSKTLNKDGYLLSFSSYGKGIILDLRTVVVSAIRSERGASAFVWSVWLVMVIAAMFALFKYALNIPFSEDWLLVPPLTGNEPDLINWLWTQNNEHRIPFPRLILLGLLRVTQGDFRAGMLFNIIILGVLALAMIRAARHLRGGRTRYVDAFFPIALLHLGNWENFFWSWQITQVIPMALSCIILLVLVSNPVVMRPPAAAAAGISLVLLPLSGGNGLIFVPMLALWLGYWGFRQWRNEKIQEGRRWTGVILIGSAAAAMALAGLYFVGYVQPPHEAPNPSILAAFQAAVQFLALGFGPAARGSWMLSMIAAIIVLLSSAIVIVLSVLHNNDFERHRALGILVFFGNVALFALAMGWGRAEVLRLPIWGGIWPTRYVLLAVPAFCTAFFIWELYGPARLRPAVQMGLFLGMFLLIPFNTVHGVWWRDWYLAGAKPLEQDLRAGMSLSMVAERNREFLFRWMDPSFDKLRMLQEADIGPFAQMQQDSVEPEDSARSTVLTQVQPPPLSLANAVDTPLVTQEFRYVMPEAGEVYLVWGLNGWQIAPEELWPVGTEVKNSVLHTPTAQAGDAFVAKLWVPAGTTIDYCFLITKKRDSFDITWPVCDGNYKQISSDNNITEVKSKLTLTLVTHEFRYSIPVEGEVDLLWGLNNWHAMPEELWPVGTEVKNNAMHTPMVQTGDTFVAKVRAPADTTINYGFLITERPGSSDIGYPIWDGGDDQGYQVIVTEGGVTEMEAALTPEDLRALVTQEFRYAMSEASEVDLVWGLDGWQVAPEGLRPAGTEVKDNVMHTPMVQDRNTFLAKVRVPAGTKIDYGFRIKERQGLFDIVYPIWDGNYQEIPTENSTREVKAAVTLAKEVSDVFDRRLYFLAGGVVLLSTWVIIFFLLGFLKR